VVNLERKQAEMQQVTGQSTAERDRKMAQECVECSLCRNEREKQKGLPIWFLHTIERLCPYRQAYEKVYGRKAHEVRS
jgi:hypothetical protein